MWDCHVEGVRVDDIISICQASQPDMIKYHCTFTYVKVKQCLLTQNSWKLVFFVGLVTHLDHWICHCCSAAVRSLCSRPSTCRYYVGSHKTHNHQNKALGSDWSPEPYPFPVERTKQDITIKKSHLYVVQLKNIFLPINWSHWSNSYSDGKFHRPNL